MNWFSNLTAPGIKRILRGGNRNEDHLWVKCPGCYAIVFHRDYAENLNICEMCGHHGRISPDVRFGFLFDEGSWQQESLDEVTVDPLKFKDSRRYVDRLRDARKKTKCKEAISIALGRIRGVDCVCAVQNFDFMGGSMGLALGQAVVKAASLALERRCPLIIFTASGGARMQEGIYSLMQMPRTVQAVQNVKQAGLPYIAVLTDPTSGGVTASFAMIGDVHIAEPGAMIAFSGPRVIEQTIGEKLPEGFQKAGYLYEKGMVDAVVPRKDQPAYLARLCRLLMNRPVEEAEEPLLSEELSLLEGDTAAKEAPASPPPAASP